MNSWYVGALIALGCFVVLWLGEYVSRVMGTERLLFILAAWTDPVRLLAYRLGAWSRDLLYRAWRRLLDLLDWGWNFLRRVREWVETFLRRMKLVELFNSFVDTLVFVGSLLVFPFQAVRGFFRLPFRDFPTIVRSVIEKHGRDMLFSWFAVAAFFAALIAAVAWARK
jgi:hypothetical protein